jgi:DNA-binding IclR family transcriptional regulator
MIGKARVLDLLARRPHSLDEITAVLAPNRNETLKLRESLLHEGTIVSTFSGHIRRFASKPP